MSTNPVADGMRGVYPILVTPFDDNAQIDETSLRRLVDHNLEAGVHGLGIALGSEVFKLSEAERIQVTQIVVDQADGKVPVVVNTGAAGTDLAVLYSRTAADHGADALMVMPPSFFPVGPDETLEYFGAISDAVSIPIFIQDTSSVPVPAGLARQLADSCRWVRYIKVESLPTTVKVAAMQQQAGDVLVIFGGAGGNYFIEEMRRGSVGTMPGCSQSKAFVAVWDAYQSGDEEEAYAVFNREILPINRLAGQGMGLFYHVHKEVLSRQGIIRSAKVRSPAPAVDDLTRREIAQTIEQMIRRNQS